MNDHELATWLAQTAGQQLLELRAKTLVPTGDDVAAKALALKGDSSANDYLIAELIKHRPEDSILSEEAKDDDIRLSANRVWIIDPVDGTYEYARSLPEFAVHVALWDSKEMRLIAGAISLPNHNLVYATNDVPVDADYVDTSRPLTIFASPRETVEVVEKLKNGLAKIAAEKGFSGVEVRNCGSVGGKVYQILSGAADVYVSSVGFFEWDAAAPAAVAAHHGLVVSDISDAALVFNQMPPKTPSFLAARPWLYAAAVAALRD
jgi:3'(2'), 5'-bisphosphate nucleotidase